MCLVMGKADVKEMFQLWWCQIGQALSVALTNAMCVNTIPAVWKILEVTTKLFDTLPDLRPPMPPSNIKHSHLLPHLRPPHV